MRVNPKQILLASVLVVGMAFCGHTPPEDPPPAGPRSQPGTAMGIYTPDQHQLYSGRFTIRAGRVYQAGRPPVFPVEGNIELDVDEIRNSGTFVATLTLPEGTFVVEMDRFHEFSPCQDGGIAAFMFEHGDSGCGDSNWPSHFCTLPAGAMAMPPSTANLCIRITRSISC